MLCLLRSLFILFGLLFNYEVESLILKVLKI